MTVPSLTVAPRSVSQSFAGCECSQLNPEPLETALPVLASIWVPAPAPWINSNTRIHRMQVAKLSAAWRAKAAEIAPGMSPFGYTVRIVAHIWKPRRGRYDPNNLNSTTKACVDGFVDAGILADDDWNHVHGPDHRHGGIGPAGIQFEFTAT